MRVLYILNTTIMGGANISFFNMVKEMKSTGVKAFVVYPDHAIDPVFLEKSNGVVEKLYYVPLRWQASERNITNLIRRLKASLKRNSFIYSILIRHEIECLLKIIDEVKPDIIHTNTGVIHSGFYAAKKRNIPHIWHIREYQDIDYDWDICPSKKDFIACLKQSNVITITNDILHHFELDNVANAQCIYNGCMSKNDTALHMPKEKFYLCCSRVSVEKCIDEVIRAFSIFYQKNRDYSLKIAGFGEESYINQLKELAESLGCKERVIFLGYCKNIKPYMDQCRALIVASRYEGFGRMTAEAGFRGCLVIGRNTGGTKEIMDKIGGVAFEGDYHDLADKMGDVCAMSDEVYLERVKDSQKYAKELFSIEQSNEKVFSIYESLCKLK